MAYYKGPSGRLTPFQCHAALFDHQASSMSTHPRMPTMHLSQYLFLSCSLLLGAYPLVAQTPFAHERYPQANYRPPLDTPLTLSGSFGEIRGRHFHAGIDYRTNSEQGHPVYAVDDGMVARVNVSTTGYGRCLYITHQNGTMSVYGHLQRFAPRIEDWVLTQQEKRRSYQVQLFPPAGLLPVKRGDIIAYSGNTGSSGGPHLHFELRNLRDGAPYNPVRGGIRHHDTIPPYFTKLYLYPLDTLDYESSLTHRQRLYFRREGTQYYARLDTIAVGPVVGLGIEAYDRVNDSSLRCGINSIVLTLNGDTVYLFDMHCVAFSESIYADAHVDYGLRRANGSRVALLFVLPGNGLSRYATTHRGLITLREGERAAVTISIGDLLGNTASLHLQLKGKANEPPAALSDARQVCYDSACDIQTKWFKLHLPARALPYNLALRNSLRDTTTRHLAPSVALDNTAVPLLKPGLLSIYAPNVPGRLRRYCFLASVAPKGRTHYFVAPCSWQGDWASAHIRSFAEYTIGVDTVPPTIAPRGLQRVCGRTLSPTAQIELTVTDQHTAIQRIDGYIDGQWKVFNWEPKTNLASYSFPPDAPLLRQEHTLRLEVRDAVGNLLTKECSFIR